MPNRDGTGPQGQGSKSGRGMGNCRKNNANDENVRSGNCGRRQGKNFGKGQNN